MLYVGNEKVIKVCQGNIELSGLAIGNIDVPVESGTPSFTPYVRVKRNNTYTVDYYSNGIIPNEQYREDSSITEVEIGSGITRIGTTDYSYVFAGCSLTGITIGENVQYIGGRAFEAIYGVQNLTIPASVTGIGTNAFYNFDENCTITFEGPLPSMSMSEDGDLGIGTHLIVPDAYFSDYCNSLEGHYCIVDDSDTGTTCGCGAQGPFYVWVNGDNTYEQIEPYGSRLLLPTSCEPDDVIDILNENGERPDAICDDGYGNKCIHVLYDHDDTGECLPWTVSHRAYMGIGKVEWIDDCTVYMTM